MRLSRAALLAALLAAAGPASAVARRSLLEATAVTDTGAATTPDGYDPNALARLDPDVLATITGTGTPRDPEAAVKGGAQPAAAGGAAASPASSSPDYQAPVELDLAKRTPSDRQSVAQVNEAAPVFKIPTKDGVVEARPALSVQGAGSGGPGAAVAAAAPAADPASLAAAAVASPGYGTAGYVPPNNPAFAAGAPAPALAALLADAASAAAPAAADLAARQAAMDASVPKFANDAAQPPEATAAKPSAAAVALAADTGAPLPVAGAQPVAAPAAPVTQQQPAAAASPAAPAGVLAVPPPVGGAGSSAAAASDNGGRPVTLNTAPNAPDGGGKAAGAGDASAGNNGAGAVAAKGIDNTSGQVLGTVGGTTLNLLLGGRVATPFFGTGFNLCVDRYFGSFPKVGVVIPNPVAWLLPEILDVAGTLKATIDLPLGGKTAPEGARVTPTSDGFVIWLPSIQPTQLGEFGFRYGLQLAQLFGVDFGFGLLKSTCTIDFVRV